MFETINGFELSREEIALCREVFAAATSEEGGAHKLIEANFENAGEICAQLERGVDEFFSMMAQETVTTEQIRQKLTEAMDGMTPADQLRYLTNVLVAMSYTGSTLHQSDAWNDMIDRCKEMLAAIENGELDQELSQNAELIPQLMDLVCGHIDDTAVLFMGNPQYERLYQACVTADADEVQMIAANNRKVSIAAAATMWTLYASGKLPSLTNPADEAAGYTPYAMGVIAACTLEMDAAQKSGVWEKVKPLLLKAARTAFILLMTGMALYGSVLLSGSIAVLAYKLFNMAGVAKVIGIFSGIYIVLTNLEEMPKIAGNLFDLGAKLVTVTVSAVREGCRRMGDFIQNHVIPGAWALWYKASEFVRTRIVDPIAAKVHPVQTGHETEGQTVPVNTNGENEAPHVSPFTVIV